MSGWQERLYKLTQREDARWLTGINQYPDDLCCDIDLSYVRGWFLRVAIPTKVLLKLQFGDRGLEALPDGSMWVPDGIRADVECTLRDLSLRRQWWTLRRAHFRSDHAQQAWEALL
jgi:hypothetical protein